MSKLLKQIISVAASAAMVAGTLVMPLAASADTELKSWKFDFGSDTDVAEGYTAVTADKSYYTDKLIANDDGYGFLGLKDTEYKLGDRIDSFGMQQGQQIKLENGGGTGLNDGVGSVGEDIMGNAGDKYYPTRFAVKVEDETYYKIKATVTTLDPEKPATASLYTERKHPIYTEKTIAAGETVTSEFTIRVTPIYYKADKKATADGMINVAVLGENTALAALEIEQVQSATTLWVLGDSTVTDGNCALPFFPLQNYTGVGTGLTKYLPSDIAMVNEGEGGLNAADNDHFNMVSSRIQQGDYMYVEYGHNHKNTNGSTYTDEYWYNDYLASLPKYYNACKTAQATLIIVGPIDRHQASQYDATTNTYSSTLSAFSDLGKKYVDCLLYGGEDTATAFVAKWGEIATKAEAKEDTAELKNAANKIWSDAVEAGKNGVSNVAFVDLNKPSLDWYAEISASGTVNDVKVTNSQALSNYYFTTLSDKPTDVTHPNDIGAENLAYFFFTKADTETYPAIEPLLANFEENKIHEEPTTVSAEIINLGAAPNSAWPKYTSPITYEYPTVVKKVSFDEETGVLKSIDVLVQDILSTYASAVVEIYGADGNKKTDDVVSVNHIDNTNGKGTFTLYFNTDVVLEEGDTYKAYIWPTYTDKEELISEEDGGEYFSAIYVPTDIEEYLLPGDEDDIETFEYLGKTNLNDDGTSWVYGGSAGETLTLDTDSKDVPYTKIKSDGAKNGVASQGSFYVQRPLENITGGIGVSGRYMIDVEAKYNSGSGLNFGFSTPSNKGAKEYPFIASELIAFTIGTNGLVTAGGKEIGSVSATDWTNIKYILDMDAGTAEVSVAGGTPVTVDVADYQTFSTPTIDSMTNFVIEGQKVAFDVDLSNLTVAKLNDSKDTATLTLDYDEGSEEFGTVYFVEEEDTENTAEDNGETADLSDENQDTEAAEGGDETATAISTTVKKSTNVTFKAEPKDGYVFMGWLSEDGSVLFDKAEVTVRLYKDLSLKAKFAPESGIDGIVSYDITADNAVIKAETNAKVTLKLENVVDKANTPVKAANTDVTWSCDDTGIDISADGVVTVNENFEIGENTTKNVTINGTLNNVKKTCKITLYSYAFYETVTGGKTSAAWDGDITEIASKDCIVFPGGGNTNTLTLPTPVAIGGDKDVSISYIAAGGGSNGQLCGQPRYIEIYDSKGNKVVNEAIAYTWGSLKVGGTIGNDNTTGTQLTTGASVEMEKWSSEVVIAINSDGTGTVSFGGDSVNITVSDSATDIAAIKLVSVKGAPVYTARALGLTEIKIIETVSKSEDDDSSSDKIQVTEPVVESDNMSVNVTNNQSDKQTAQMIIVCYDENEYITGIKLSTKKEIAAGATETLSAAKPSGNSYKVLLWDSVENAKPLTGVVASTVSE